MDIFNTDNVSFNKNQNELTQLFDNQLREHYFGIYYLYLDFGLLTVLKTEHPYLIGESGKSCSYMTLCKFLKSLSNEQDRQYVNNISDINYLKRIFSKNNFGSYNFKSLFNEFNSKIGISWFVLQRDEKNTPSVLALAFNYLQNNAFDEDFDIAASVMNTPELPELNSLGPEKPKINKMIENIVLKYDLAYSVNISDDSFKIMRLDEHILLGHERKFDTFSEVKEFFLNEIIHPADRSFMENELSYPTIIQKLNEFKAYSLEYRSFIDGTFSWNEMSVTSISEGLVLIGFSLKDSEITKNRLSEITYNEYTSLFVIDVDSQTFKAIKKAPLFQMLPLNKAFSYKLAMEQFSQRLSGEFRDFFKQISDMKNLLEKFANDDKFTYSFKSGNINNEKWIDMTGFIISKHEDMTPAMIAIGCSLSDTLAVERQEIQTRLKEDMHIISGLAESFDTLFYINISDNIFEIFRFNGEYHPNVSQFTAECKNPFECLHKLIKNEEIHPEDVHILDKINSDYLKKKLSHSKQYHKRFRRLINNEYQWSEITAIKYEDTDEQPNALVIGISSYDEEIQSQQAINNCFKILTKEVPINESINILLSILGKFYDSERTYLFEFSQNNETIKNIYEWHADKAFPELNTPEISDDVNINVFNWLKRQCFHGTTFLDISDTSELNSELRVYFKKHKLSSLLITPIINDDEVVGLTCIDNPKKSIKNSDIIKTVAAVSHSELLQQNEKDEEHITLAKLANAFESVYYVDLNNDYIRSWKMASERKDYYDVIQKYSSMADYIKKHVAISERERCLKMTDADYVLEQFKTKDRFSIEMTDTFLKQDRNFVYDYIRVNDEGSQFVICCKDVTDTMEKEKQQNQQLEKARLAAVEANNSKTNFLFNMSHDIRTPMNAIIGFTNMAQKHIDDKERVMDYLDKIDTSGLQLLSLINQVLEMARIEAGRIEIEENPINIMDEYNSMVTVLTEQAKSFGLKFNHSTKNITHPYILADKARLNSICLNIAGNSIKYTPKGGTINYTVEEIESKREGYASYVLTVRDTGIGMSKDYLKIIFEPFTREKSSTVSKIQGTGLGMSIVKNLVDHMGGEIKVESELGKGTFFTINIDFKIDVNCSANTNSATKPNKVSFDGYRILLVEDNELNREIANAILNEKGIITTDAENGSVALDILKEKGPDYFDIILMDIQMPVMNGYEATVLIKELYPDLKAPIIALSANAFSEDKEHSLSVGMVDHISKPFNITEMFNTLAKYIR